VSTLTLVRHGQAISFEREAGVLSPLGEAQAEKLGRYWLAGGTRFDEVYTGCLARQVRTEQVIAGCFREAGEPWPDVVRDPAWNEYDATGVLGPSVPLDSREFQRQFEKAMLAWLEAEAPAEGVEPWPVFRDRVSGAIQRLMAGPSGRRVAVFTSGGPIGLSVQLAMKAPERSFLEVNWRVRNCSVTELVFTRDRLTLDSFNCIAHLDEPELRTYR
jgi:broad specificity phosphatase PhoE